MKITLCFLALITGAFIFASLENKDVQPLSANKNVDQQAKQLVSNSSIKKVQIVESSKPLAEEVVDTNPEPDPHRAQQHNKLNIELPGEDVEFKLQLSQSSFHNVQGKAKSTIGESLYRARLLPSNEVELELILKQDESDDKTMKAYFDLANHEMELDGGNAILNQDHKRLMKIAADHLRHHFMQQYQDLDVPEHAFMLVQMLSYWSMAPKGFVYEKRTVQSQ